MKKILILSFLVVLLSSCGGTTVKVKQSSDGVNATISVQTNNPTDVEVNPSISVSLDELSELLKDSSDTLVFNENNELSFTASDLVRFNKDKLYNMAVAYGYL